MYVHVRAIVISTSRGVGDKHQSTNQPTNQPTERESESVNQRRTDNVMAKRKRTTGQTLMYKTQHIKLKIEQHKPGKNSGAPEECAVPASHVAPVMLLLIYFTSHIRKHQLALFTVTLVMKVTNKINIQLH